MIDIDKAIKEFIKYTENYDLTNDNIKRKQLHSIRVMKLCGIIAESLNLNEEQIELAKLIGLLHDIARFEQFTQYRTYHDSESFDHGDYGAEILKNDIRNYVKIEKYDNIIITAVKNHNKYAIDENLQNDELLYAQIIRDADKIDIIYECIDIFWKNQEDLVEKSIISDEIYREFKTEKQIKRIKEHNFSMVENLCSTIAFIFDLNFKESFKILRKENYINKIIDRFNFKDDNTKEKIEEIRKIANKYIEKSITEDVQ